MRNRRQRGLLSEAFRQELERELGLAERPADVEQLVERLVRRLPHERRIGAWRYLGEHAPVLDRALALELAREVRPQMLLKNRGVPEEVRRAVAEWLVRIYIEAPKSGGWFHRREDVATEIAAFGRKGVLSLENEEVRRLRRRSEMRAGYGVLASDLRIWLSLADCPPEALLAAARRSELPFAKGAIRHPAAFPDVWLMAYRLQGERPEIRLALVQSSGALGVEEVRRGLMNWANAGDTRLYLHLGYEVRGEEFLELLRGALRQGYSTEATALLNRAQVASLSREAVLELLASPHANVRQATMLLTARQQREQAVLPTPASPRKR